MKSIFFIICFLSISLLRAQSVVGSTPKLQNAESIVNEINDSKKIMNRTIVPEIATSNIYQFDSIFSPKPELVNKSTIIKEDVLYEKESPEIIRVNPPNPKQ